MTFMEEIAQVVEDYSNDFSNPTKEEAIEFLQSIKTINDELFVDEDVDNDDQCDFVEKTINC